MSMVFLNSWRVMSANWFTPTVKPCVSASLLCSVMKSMLALKVLKRAACSCEWGFG